MILPISDDNPHHGTPYVTWTLIGTCVLVFLYQTSLDMPALKQLVFQYGFIPAAAFGDTPLDTVAMPGTLTIFTSMFLHGDWMHLIGNMLYLWIFGDNIEVAMGRARFLVFYLLCGIGAALAQSIFMYGNVPMIGASGAISGVLGAYLLLYPRANIRVLLMMFYIGIVNIPAKIVLGGWFLIQFLSGVADNGGGAGVAFWAHIGGFVCGMALVKLFIRKDEHLFHKQVTRPWGTSRLSDKNKPKGPWGLG